MTRDQAVELYDHTFKPKLDSYVLEDGRRLTAVKLQMESAVKRKTPEEAARVLEEDCGYRCSPASTRKLLAKWKAMQAAKKPAKKPR